MTARTPRAIARDIRKDRESIIDAARRVDRVRGGGAQLSELLDRLGYLAFRLERYEQEYREAAGKGYRP